MSSEHIISPEEEGILIFRPTVLSMADRIRDLERAEARGERLWSYVGCWSVGVVYQSSDGHRLLAADVAERMGQCARDQNLGPLQTLDREVQRRLEYEVLALVDAELGPPTPST